jgi:alpha-L-fucosidase
LIGNFIDIISKNGNLLLNVGLRGDGTLPENQAAVLREMGDWLKINGEAVYGSRPWLVFGEGPTKITTGAFNEPNSDYTPEDIRFTVNNGFLYAFMLKANEKTVKIRSLSNLLNQVNEIKSVELLGSNAKLTWEHNRDGLVIQLPEKLPTQYAPVLKIGLDDLSSQQWELIIE